MVPNMFRLLLSSMESWVFCFKSAACEINIKTLYFACVKQPENIVFNFHLWAFCCFEEWCTTKGLDDVSRA